MTATETIRELGQDLPIGASLMAECPFCQATHERKLAVTRYEDGLGYVCYRASCSRKGAIPLASSGAVRDCNRGAPVKKEFKPREFSGPLEPPHGYAAELLGRIGLVDPGWSIRSSGPDTAVYGLMDFTGNVRGWTSRTRSKQINSGRLVDKPLYGYYTSCYLQPLWMWFVEDPLSAIRLAEHCQNAVALCGTHASYGLLNELWDEYPNCRRIYVAMDPGAEDAARKIVTKCRYEYGLDAIQVLLPDDIHRLDSATLKTILETYR